MRKPSRRHQQYVRKMLNKKECGHWHVTGEVNRHGAVIKHNASGKTLLYSTGDVGADMHSARNFAAQAGAICGCDLAPKRRTRPGRTKRLPRRDYTTRTANEEAALKRRECLFAERAGLLAKMRLARPRDPMQKVWAVRVVDIENELISLWAPPPEDGWLIERRVS